MLWSVKSVIQLLKLDHTYLFAIKIIFVLSTFESIMSFEAISCRNLSGGGVLTVRRAGVRAGGRGGLGLATISGLHSGVFDLGITSYVISSSIA